MNKPSISIYRARPLAWPMSRSIEETRIVCAMHAQLNLMPWRVVDPRNRRYVCYAWGGIIRDEIPRFAKPRTHWQQTYRDLLLVGEDILKKGGYL